jgi:hypothetical protein
MYFTAIVLVQYRADICEIEMINMMTGEDIPALINLNNVQEVRHYRTEGSMGRPIQAYFQIT